MSERQAQSATLPGHGGFSKESDSGAEQPHDPTFSGASLQETRELERRRRAEAEAAESLSEQLTRVLPLALALARLTARNQASPSDLLDDAGGEPLSIFIR